MASTRLPTRDEERQPLDILMYAVAVLASLIPLYIVFVLNTATVSGDVLAFEVLSLPLVAWVVVLTIVTIAIEKWFRVW
jgi:hypothetical protein